MLWQSVAVQMNCLIRDEIPAEKYIERADVERERKREMVSAAEIERERFHC